MRTETQPRLRSESPVFNAVGVSIVLNFLNILKQTRNRRVGDDGIQQKKKMCRGVDAATTTIFEISKLMREQD